MKNLSSFTNIILAVLFFVLFRSYSAHAYIDPGIGSYIFQLLIAGLVGASFLIKVFWGEIKVFFSKYVLRRSSDEDE